MRLTHWNLRRAGGAALALALLATGAGGTGAERPTTPERPRGPYFGQSPPGAVPRVFAPGIVSLDDRYEYVIAFSPDGKESCFGVTDATWSTCDLYCSRQEGGLWSRPAKAAFQGDGDGWLPFFTPDGKWLLFSSGRPDILKLANSWRSARTARGWGDPEKMKAPVNSPAYDWRPTVTSRGTLYFSSDREGGVGESDIYRSPPVEGAFPEVENLGPPVNSPHHEASPYPSPDERFLTFESWRPGGYGQADLYISYRRSDGSWTEPQNLGPLINTDQIDDGGSIPPDGKYFFFNRRRAWETQDQTDLHWVDIRAILRPYVRNPVGVVTTVAGKAMKLRLPDDQFGDADDDVLVYSARSAGGGLLPPWLAFDAGTRTLTGTAPDAGDVTIEITATDSMGSVVSDRLTIRAAP